MVNDHFKWTETNKDEKITEQHNYTNQEIKTSRIEDIFKTLKCGHGHGKHQMIKNVLEEVRSKIRS